MFRTAYIRSLRTPLLRPKFAPLIMQRRVASNKPANQDDAHTKAHGGSCSHDHEHKHGIFSTHHHDHSEGAEQLITALSSGRLDRGTKVTLLGLGSNVVLTAGKGLAGIWMNSASLLAEAGHSLSDLLGVSSENECASHLPPPPRSRALMIGELTAPGLCNTGNMENIQTATI